MYVVLRIIRIGIYMFIVNAGTNKKGPVVAAKKIENAEDDEDAKPVSKYLFTTIY